MAYTLNIRNIDKQLILRARTKAMLRGLTLRDWVAGVISDALEVDGADSRGAGGSEAGEVERGRHRATVPHVRKAKSDEERLHPVQPVRTELDQRGAGDRSASAGHATHHVYRDGDRQWCSDCKLHF